MGSQAASKNGNLSEIEPETAPLLGPPSAALVSRCSEPTHGTFADSSIENDIEHGSPQGKITARSNSSNEPTKHETKLVMLMPALAIGIFLVALDQTLTIATYGKIGSDLRALNSTGWVATSYFLTLTTFQPLYGKLSDIFGRKPCLLFCYTVFGLGCLGCGLARNIIELCVARAISGVGGGGMTALVSILITDLVSLRDRGVWQSYINIFFSAGMSAGAPIGGLCADSIGWRWAFIIQCPIALMAFLSVYLALHLPQTDSTRWSTKFLRIDFTGALTLVTGIFLLIFGLDNGSNVGWRETITVVPLALAPVIFAAFVLVETKVAQEPFAPGHVILHPPLLATYGANFFGVAAQMGVFFFIALFFQAALGLSATTSGLIFMPSTFFSLSAALGTGLAIRYTGRYYWLTLSFGYCLVFLSIVPMVVGAGAASAALTGIGLSVLASGSSAAITSTLVAIVANTAPEDAAVAIACSYLFRSLGTTIGISVSTATLQQMLRVGLERELGGAGRAREIEERVRLSLDYIRRLDPAVAAVVRRCYAVATQWAFAPIAVLSGLAIASAIFIRERGLER